MNIIRTLGLLLLMLATEQILAADNDAVLDRLTVSSDRSFIRVTLNFLGMIANKSSDSLGLSNS
jgi:hypothetical protein